MKAALFEPSISFRQLVKEALKDVDVTWLEFEGIENCNFNVELNDLDFVITAQHLSDGRYYELLKKIEHSGCSKLPVYLITSSETADLVNQAFSYGVVDLFTKQDLSYMSVALHRTFFHSERCCNAHLLLIEDELSVAKYYTYSLEKAGFNVTIAANYDQVQNALRDPRLELIITDLNLEGGLRGQSIIREIRRNKHDVDAAIPILVLSADTSIQNQLRLFHIGADDYFTKPAASELIVIKALAMLEKFRSDKDVNKNMNYYREQANYDPLTKAYNRNGFLEISKLYIGYSERKNTKLVILFIDLDNFKQVNDNYGHNEGDAVLQSIATIFRENIRGYDILGRFGGDEFVILLKDAEKPDAIRIAERILDKVVQSKDQLHGVSCSIGLSIGLPSSIEDLQQLLDQADEAMYKAKREGKSAVQIA